MIVRKDPQRLSATQIPGQKTTTTSSSSSSSSKTASKSNTSLINSKIQKNQSRKSLTPQQQQQQTSLPQPPSFSSLNTNLSSNSTNHTQQINSFTASILDRAKMIDQRKNLGKLIVEYEFIGDREEKSVDAESPRKLLSVHKNSTFPSMLHATEQPVKENDTNGQTNSASSNQSTKSDSSLSSVETLKLSSSSKKNRDNSPKNVEESNETNKSLKERYQNNRLSYIYGNLFFSLLSFIGLKITIYMKEYMSIYLTQFWSCHSYGQLTFRIKIKVL